MNSYERKRRICKMIVLVLGILSINNIILTIRNYSYAYFEKNVKTGVKLKITTLDEMPSKGEIATKVIKDTIGTTGGVIGVTTSNTEVKVESSNIREYRYSGIDVNNYIYFNCQDGTTYKNASTNCELWRIVGVFKDESGNEHLKIVKNEVLDDVMKWSGASPYSNDWTKTKINDYLNSTYYNTLSPNIKNMIEETKYYLGSITSEYVAGNVIYDNPKESYANERDIKSCVNNTGSSATASGCRVWSGNKATWTGNIALLYPSDYGFSATSNYWSIAFYKYNSDAMNTSWLQKANHNKTEWLLTPSTVNSQIGVNWTTSGNLDQDFTFNYYSVRPTLYLKSEVRILDETTGLETNPYFLTGI